MKTNFCYVFFLSLLYKMFFFFTIYIYIYNVMYVEPGVGLRAEARSSTVSKKKNENFEIVYTFKIVLYNPYESTFNFRDCV